MRTFPWPFACCVNSWVWMSPAGSLSLLADVMAVFGWVAALETMDDTGCCDGGGGSDLIA